MKNPTPQERERIRRQIDAQLAQLNRTPTPEERRSAAQALGLEDWLPDPQPELALAKARACA